MVALVGPPAVTEVEARQLLRRWPGVGQLEAMIADLPWDATPDGWRVIPAIQGWRVDLTVVADGIRIAASAPSTSAQRF